MNLLEMRLFFGRAVFFFVLMGMSLSFPLQVRADAANDNKIPLKIKSSSKAVIQIYLSDKLACSAVRISEEYILSAAHCFYRLNGKLMKKRERPTFIKKHGRKY